MIARALIQEALQGFLDADVKLDVWDETPDLLVIIQEKDGSLQFGPVPVDDATWEVAEPFRVVRAVADATRRVNQLSGWTPFEPGQVLLGIVLFTEGWGLTQNDTSSLDVIRAWMGDGHRLSEHPLSVEIKLVTAVLVDDEPIMLMHGRGGVPLPNGDAGGMEGRVPEALTYALTAFRELTREE